MEKKQKLFALSAACILLAGMLAGCGKAEPDPNSGLYEGTKATMSDVTMNVNEVYKNGVTFDIQDGGKCACNLDGEEFTLNWTREGDKIHFEGGGAELNGTIGGGDLVITNMMDRGMDLELHCDNLLHADMSNEEGSERSSVLARLKDAKNGKNVYSGAASAPAATTTETASTETASAEGTSKNDSIPVNEDGSIDGELFLNPDYKSVTGKKFEGSEINVTVPDGWAAFDVSNGHICVIKGGSSPSDYMSNASIQVEWHADSTGSIDPFNMEDPVKFSGLKLGQHNYNGVYGTVPGNWSSYMMIDQSDKGYFLVTLSLPENSDVYILDSDVQAIMASVEAK